MVSLREWMAQGRLGDVLHVDVEVALDVLGDKSPLVTGHGQPFVLELRGGLVADFLPHLASLANAFLGPHEAAHSVWSRRSESRLASDEWRALVQHGSGTSSLGFSANAKPAGFRLTVVGTQMRARSELYGTLLTVETDRRAAGPLEPVLNGLSVSLAEFSGAVGGLRRKLDGGPAALEGLWALVDQLYRDLGAGRQPTLGHINVREVNSLVQDLLRNAP